jgi:hypothetical protein
MELLLKLGEINIRLLKLLARISKMQIIYK